MQTNKVREYFGVIDTETTWNNDVMSIGIVVADSSFLPVCKKYYIITPECDFGGMYSDMLNVNGINIDIKASHSFVMKELIDTLQYYNVRYLFAYNARFDYRHLPELHDYIWFDIMKIAAYKQFNKRIPETAECCATGRLKRNYGVESMMRMLSGNATYHETHNAVLDAEDELKIMKLLRYSIDTYVIAQINPFEVHHLQCSFENNIDHDKTVDDVNEIQLSEEQQKFIDQALQGKNILVNACIGSGKTTAIQLLCNKIPSSKSILYLTYNRLLKLDAQKKIKSTNVTVQNYHGIAKHYLNRIKIYPNVNDLITCFNKIKPLLDHYDILMIDEYQDIETEFSILLEYIKSSNPQMQIIAVGDMHQKIYNKTTLNVSEFIQKFLDEYLELEFTKCFRLSAPLAERLGRIWQKTISGVNSDCIVEEMNVTQVIDFLSKQKTKDILCLGSRKHEMVTVLNILEQRFPEKFNKNTVYASISNNDTVRLTNPTSESAIFTTFDSSKGLERNVCVVFDYTESYWKSRISRPQQSYEILRNIFCVAASRGKSRIIFVTDGTELLSEETLSTDVGENAILPNFDIRYMFDFKYRENIEMCYSLLNVKPILSGIQENIEVKSTDGMINLSPCIDIYQKAMFFDKYDIDKAIEEYFTFQDKNKRKSWVKDVENFSLEQKILFLVSQETGQSRYTTQVDLPFVNLESKKQITDCLSTRFNKDEAVQIECRISFSNENDGEILFIAGGLADVVKNNIVYELKFVSELSHEHFLQCACYMVALNLETGILWNIRDNTAYSITISDKEGFLDAVVKTITKNRMNTYFRPSIDNELIHNEIPEFKTNKANEEIITYSKNDDSISNRINSVRTEKQSFLSEYDEFYPSSKSKKYAMIVITSILIVIGLIVGILIGVILEKSNDLSAEHYQSIEDYYSTEIIDSSCFIFTS